MGGEVLSGFIKSVNTHLNTSQPKILHKFRADSIWTVRFSFYPSNLQPKTNNLIKNDPFKWILYTLSEISAALLWNASQLCVNKKTMQCKKHNNLFCSSLSFDHKKTFSDEKWKMIRHGRSLRYSNLDNNQPSVRFSLRTLPVQFIKHRQIDLELGLMF